MPEATTKPDVVPKEVDSDSEDDFINKPDAVFSRNKDRKKSDQEAALSLANNPPPRPEATRYAVELPVEEEHVHTWYRLTHGETFIQALRKFDPKLVTKASNTVTVFVAHQVLEGEIGKALHKGRTKFYGPGQYAALGVGKEWIGTEKLLKEGKGWVNHQDVTILSLSENQLAVVTIGKAQYPVGAGQYIFRLPSKVEGEPIDIQTLGKAHKTSIITEGTKAERDLATGKLTNVSIQGTKEITAGWTAKAGAITLIRPEPGFHYIVQTPSGFRMGPEYTYARGEETFHGFMNFLQQSRTTKRFSFLSLDRQRAEMTVQMTWIMRDGVKWLTKGRAYDDPFDMLEEKAEAFFRDAVGAMDHMKALKEKSDGFNTIELEIFTKLSNAASALGAKLMSIEVRELSFPQLEAQEQKLAVKDAETKAKKLEAQREIELRKLEDEKLAALELASHARAKIAAEAVSLQMKIEDATALAQVEAQSAQNLARQRGRAEEEKAQLKSIQEITKMKGETAKLIAKNESEVMAVQLRTQNMLNLERAQAEAKAAEALAKVLISNPSLLELKKMEIWAEVEKDRYRTLALFADNSEALLPEAAQRDLVRMRHGEHPQDYIHPSMAGEASLPYSGKKK